MQGSAGVPTADAGAGVIGEHSKVQDQEQDANDDGDDDQRDENTSAG